MNYFFTAIRPTNTSFSCTLNIVSSKLFGSDHAIFFFVTAFAVSLLLFLSRHVNKLQYDLIILITAVTITVSEVLKIIICIINRAPLDNFLPLYFCGLFNFAIWFAKSKKRVLSIMGYSYITMGGIVAGIFFLLYPSTALGMYPLYHPSVLHSAFFHGAMIYIGVLTLMRGFYRPENDHIKYYFYFVTVATVLAAIINASLGTNCMFLRDPFGLPLLAPLCDRSPLAYMLIAWIGQAYVLFKISIMLFELFIKKKRKY